MFIKDPPTWRWDTEPIGGGGAISDISRVLPSVGFEDIYSAKLKPESDRGLRTLTLGIYMPSIIG